jgi:riboflavin biosynthesis pyrimidine reductase
MRIVLIAAQSLDGFIAKPGQPGTAFTSPEDKARFRAMVADFDVTVFGGSTYRVSREAIRAQTPGRPLRIVLTRAPDRYAAEAFPGRLEFTSAPPAAIVHDLGARGFSRCALLGGSQIHSLFLAAGLVEEIWLTIEPLLFGAGTPLLADPAGTRLELQSLEKLGTSTLLAKYNVLR